MAQFCCPLCGRDSICKKTTGERNGFVPFFCDTFHAHYSLADEIIDMTGGEEKEQLLDLVVEELVHRPTYKNKQGACEWQFYYDPDEKDPDSLPPHFINLARRINNYPQTTLEKIDRGLLNLSFSIPQYGDVIEFNYSNLRLLFEHNRSNSLGMHSIIDLYVEMGYLSRVRQTIYMITAAGWLKIDELRKRETTVKQAFIAMQFSEETQYIREAFREAIRASGYSERIIDEKEHNNQIVPEIFYEIQRSKFMVVDITYPNHGAYYEAGYAQALGKEVIICCQENAFHSKEKRDRPHFDIAQKSMIVWTDVEDLKQRLKRRIEATI